MKPLNSTIFGCRMMMPTHSMVAPSSILSAILRVGIQYLPMDISVQSSSERSYFANKMKAINRLKAKLQVIANEQRVSSISSIKKKNAIVNPWQ